MDKERDIERIGRPLIGYLPKNIYDPCCGDRQLPDYLRSQGFTVVESDYCNGYGTDFLSLWNIPFNNIVTIPPINPDDYVEHALAVMKEGGIAAFLIRTSFLEGQERYKRIFRYNKPKIILQFSQRIDKTRYSFSWMVWEKGYKGKTTLEWI